ncbi:MAG: adenylosuccinate lyase [Deltaproteobacteria bacterium HGW-Deltaproteobacteria-14]|nr:MAG: adenylosuccinate lyase [Deltaproteobacteria bacterium HGW-Deltaproteobacteria-14]
MSERFDHETYLSPFTWRYGSAELRAVWSEAHKRRTWRRIWVAVARAQAAQGLVTEAQVADLLASVNKVDIAAAHALEAELQHDLMAEVHVYAGQCPVGGGIIHLGCTSMDIEDNADALRLRESLDVVIAKLRAVLRRTCERARDLADHATMGFTHLQPAEPTTLGYRFAQYAQDLAEDLRTLEDVRARVRGKGFKGATGTSASYAELFGGIAAARAFEDAVLAELELPAFEVATQTYPRKQDLQVVTALSGLAQSLYRFAYDLRLLQSPPIGEWSEPFGARQIGSSAMPFKKNPINAENMDSLARLVASLPRVAWDNAAHSHLERTLDDSANRRVMLPQAFLASDELLRRADRLMSGLVVDAAASARLLATYGPFAATERLLMEAVKRGGDRQALHEVVRRHTLAAWPAVKAGAPSPLAASLAGDVAITAYVRAGEIPELLDASAHVGDAPERARALAERLLATLTGG